MDTKKAELDQGKRAQSQKENLTQSFVGVTSLATNRQALEKLIEKMLACYRRRGPAPSGASERSHLEHRSKGESGAV